MTPTARSLEYCRKNNLDAGVVERWNPHSQTRSDLYGFLDILVMEPGTLGLLGVQATTGSNAAARITKILAEPRALRWLETGNRIEVWSWRRIKVKRGGTAFRWELACRQVTVADFERSG